MKREFLQLAQTFNPKKHGPAGWFASEKLDGMRAFWDGGITRGIPASEIPWANTEKDFRLLHKVVSTGLWSRYGKVIHAPDWWLDKMPYLLLDGELFAGREKFQTLISTVKDHVPGPGWMDVRFLILDSPPPEAIFADGKINNTNFKKDLKGCSEYFAKSCHEPMLITRWNQDFCLRQSFIRSRVGINEIAKLHEQERLPFSTTEANDRINQKLNEVLDKGGEGLVIKAPNNLWQPERSWTVLKYKPWHDAEGTVVGYTWGRETDKGSKLLGLMGALIVKSDTGKEFMLSGFTDAERKMASIENLIEAPGSIASEFWYNPIFPRGTRITYRYRELTDDGIPKEARYWRKYHD